MSKLKIKLIAVSLWMTVVACATQFMPDPNANTVLTVQYEDEAPRIVLRDDCKAQLDCAGKTEEQCAIALFEDSQKYIDEGEKMEQKKFYLTATVEYMQAMSRLIEAEIRLKRVNPLHPLQDDIRRRMNHCRIKVKKIQWTREQGE